jgi:hypothetical protein
MPRGKYNRKKAAVVVAAPVRGAVAHYNQQRMIDLWSKGKSVTEIAQDQNCSPVYARRVLATKAPEAYQAGLQARHATMSVVGASGKPAGKPANGNGNGHTTLSSADVRMIAAAVASATYGDAKIVPIAQTREELFNNIQRGVKEGAKKLGFGFHS